MRQYDNVRIGGLEAVLKDEKALLRVLEIDGGIGEIKGEGSKTNLKFINTEGFNELFEVSAINEIVVSSGNGEVFRGLCRLVRMDLEGKGYGFRGGDFEVRIIGNNAVWFDLLKGVSLRDLDWGDLEYTQGAIIDGFLANHLTAKFGFGLGKWGKWKNDDGGDSFYVDLDESTFIGFLKFIIENGFKKVGYSVESKFFDSFFVSLGMPFAMKVYDEEWLKKRYDVECVVNLLKVTRIDSNAIVTIGNADGGQRNSSTSVFNEILNNPIKENGERLFRDLGRPSWFQKTPQIPPNSPNRFSYECVKSGDYEIYMGNENYTSLNDLYILNMDVLINCPLDDKPNLGVYKGNIKINDSIIVNLTEGDVVDVNFWIGSPFANSIELEDIKWGIKWAREVDLTRKWLIGGLMPDWKISDILSGCVHGFNLKFDTEDIFKVVTIEPSDEWSEGVNSFKEGFYRDFNDEGYEIDVRDKIMSKRVKNRLILSERGEWEKRDLPKSIAMRYGLDSVGSGIYDRLKGNILEGKIIFDSSDSEKVEDYENPFFQSTYQIYESRIKGGNSKFTPLVPFLGDFDYYDKEEEEEAVYNDVPRLLCFGGQRVFVNDYVKGGTVRMNGNNNYVLPSIWTVNYNDEDGSDLSVSFGEEYNVKGIKIWGLVKRFYLKEFLRIEKGNRYKMILEYGVGRVSFRDVFDYDGRVLILKKVEGFDGRDRQFCKTYFDEDVFVLNSDFNKVKDVIVKGAGNVL